MAEPNSPYESPDSAIGRIARSYQDGTIAYSDAVDQILEVCLKHKWTSGRTQRDRDYAASFLND